MNKKKIKKSLMEYTVPKYEVSAFEKTIKTIHKMTFSNADKRMNSIDFFISQIGFIRKRTWIIQFLVLCTICALLFNTSRDNNSFYEILSLVSVAVPLFILTNIEEIAKVYNNSVLEIEFSTKNTLHKIIATRMIVFGVSDLLFMCVILLLAKQIIDINTLYIIIYILVPFNLMCIGCLEIINRNRGKSTNYYCMIYGTSLVLLIFMLGTFKNSIYQFESIEQWLIIFLVTSVILIHEIKKTWKHLCSFENIII
ncbi:hypothetical protein IC218_04340 [Clostridioides sp. ES-S-0005-03]|uniref:hypothetical protein n=1 Tax=Clostridioides sp. ES-S-0005-03 TaxID=2770774 RepID=UPI001D122EAD|nr:hypothetical protein [Clostridioides sp. ES-S-0005-03]UDN49279.1 hypothetical protein JJJ25_09555 [Clostridioides sp. ES-S-0173-01]